ncbi:hypothetical protein K439DRAFT_1239465, partial [Ramaria rubella]
DTLVSAVKTSSHAELDAFIPIWCDALWMELCTNASGCGAQKFPTIAENVADNFPSLDVLLSYVVPITSGQAGLGRADTLWHKEVDVGKVTRVCEMYFEWGIESTIIKRFRTLIWPGAVLRMFLR